MAPATQPSPEIPTDDTALDQKIGILLRLGVFSSAFVILIGGAMFLAQHGTDRADFGTFRELPSSLRSPLRIVASALKGNALGIVQLGVLLLIATPVARVIFSCVAFALRKDVLYVVISGIVLIVLFYSLIFG